MQPLRLPRCCILRGIAFADVEAAMARADCGGLWLWVVERILEDGPNVGSSTSLYSGPRTWKIVVHKCYAIEAGV
ncbi:hypothetical protein C8J57DRAFT_1301669 [Mycena rebaudengoi]|nr:hypothetical protein C8J57DRAFT_1301669 [Mycena rebaudengoi]